MKRTPNTFLLLGSIGAALLCLWLIGTATLTDREALLVSVVLTIASTLSSWVISRYYAEESFNENLRVFALKAAEKVNNLSNELDRLAVFLQSELEDTDYSSPAEQLLGRETRIEGGIHIIKTLKSVNDRSLSDWQGVIGKELDERREEEEERAAELRELVERVEALQQARIETPREPTGSSDGAIRAEVNAIRSDLRVLASQVGGVTVRRPKVSRQDIDLPCPKCGENIHLSQKRKANSMKIVKCPSCSERVLSMMKADNFVLEVFEPKNETVSCPVCTAGVSVTIDPVPGSIAAESCLACGCSLKVTRSLKGLTTRLVEAKSATPVAPVPLTEAVIEAVASAMPPQPWPTGAARQVANALQLPPRTVADALKVLMERGRFKLQIKGQLFERSGS